MQTEGKYVYWRNRWSQSQPIKGEGRINLQHCLETGRELGDDVGQVGLDGEVLGPEVSEAEKFALQFLAVAQQTLQVELGHRRSGVALDLGSDGQREVAGSPRRRGLAAGLVEGVDQGAVDLLEPTGRERGSRAGGVVGRLGAALAIGLARDDGGHGVATNRAPLSGWGGGSGRLGLGEQAIASLDDRTHHRDWAVLTVHLKVEAACIADGLALGVATPQRGGGGLAVRAGVRGPSSLVQGGAAGTGRGATEPVAVTISWTTSNGRGARGGLLGLGANGAWLALGAEVKATRVAQHLLVGATSPERSVGGVAVGTAGPGGAPAAFGGDCRLGREIHCPGLSPSLPFIRLSDDKDSSGESDASKPDLIITKGSCYLCRLMRSSLPLKCEFIPPNMSSYGHHSQPSE